jgi:hypothetical protein
MQQSRQMTEKRHSDSLWIAKERDEDEKLKLELSPHANGDIRGLLAPTRRRRPTFLQPKVWA